MNESQVMQGISMPRVPPKNFSVNVLRCVDSALNMMTKALRKKFS
jgi:hypothetical protein